MKVWINGRLVDEPEAVVPVNDHGLTVGDGVFETIKTYEGRPFALRRHLERLAASAGGLSLDPPPADVLASAVHEVCAANRLGDAVVRITVTGGPGPPGSSRGTEGPTAVVTSGALHPWAPSESVVVVPWPRNERGALAGLKTTSYGENVVALAWARKRNAGEAIFANLAGNLCEGTGTNVFLVFDGRLVTPPLSSGCLAGVTRALLLERAGAVEQDVPIDALSTASEAFLTSTTREVHPIGSIDGKSLSPVPGPVTAAAAHVFAQLVAANMDP